jgi:hypothetical protein
MTCDQCPLSLSCFSGYALASERHCARCGRWRVILCPVSDRRDKHDVWVAVRYFVACPEDGPWQALRSTALREWYCLECDPAQYDDQLPDRYPMLLR